MFQKCHNIKREYTPIMEAKRNVNVINGISAFDNMAFILDSKLML